MNTYKIKYLQDEYTLGGYVDVANDSLQILQMGHQFEDLAMQNVMCRWSQQGSRTEAVRVGVAS